MAVDVCSEISSPRISFSHDLKELDFIPVEKSASDFDFNFDFDFDFCTGKCLSQEISSADELFADGKILPIQIKKTHHISSAHKKPESETETTIIKKRLIEFLSTNFDGDGEEEEEKPATKPFWQFRRSSSVNCENGRRNGNGNGNGNGLLRSLHFLTRSNSTGSVPNPNSNKPSPIPKIVMQKQQSLKEGSTNRANSYAPSFDYYKNPSLRKSRSYGNGVRVSPVLNIPPTYIAKGSVGLFGIGSFFCSKKSQKKKIRK